MRWLKANDQRGAILIVTLWIVGLLAILFSGIAYRLSIELRQSRNFLHDIQARAIAQAGIVQALDQVSMNKKAYDTLFYCGIDPTLGLGVENLFKEVKVPGGDFSVFTQEGNKITYGLLDEERKININAAPTLMLQNLPDVSKELAQSIVDWRDKDNNPTFEGAEQSDYDSLPHPYGCRNAPFKLVEELLLVKGMTQANYDKIKNLVTVYGDAEGRVNINTATEKTLKVLGMSDFLIKKIMIHRKGQDETEGTGDDGYFTDPETIRIDTLSLVEQAEFDSFKKFFKVSSSYFRIESHARLKSSDMEKVVMAVVQKGSGTAGGPSFVYYREI